MDEPPALVDPRRWGGLVGLGGAAASVASCSPPLGVVVLTVGWVLGAVGLASASVLLYVRPTALGPLARPGAAALAMHVGCVVGELVLIGVGTRALETAGRGELRPALIAAVVGLHVIPFAWAVGERMFLHLGAGVAGLGLVGLPAGALGVPRAAEASAVLAGLVMLAIIHRYARGRFVVRR